MPESSLAFDYNERTGTVSVSGEQIEGDLVIPAEYEGYPVTEIKPAGFRGCTITSLTLPDSIQTVGDYAFQNCTKLEKISFGNGVETLGSKAFANCTVLESITLPNSVKTLGEGCFSECSALAHVTLSEKIKSLPKECFKDTAALEKLILPEGMTTLAEYAVCAKDIYLPSTLETVHCLAIQTQYDKGKEISTNIHIDDIDRWLSVKITGSVDRDLQFFLKEEPLAELVISEKYSTVPKAASMMAGIEKVILADTVTNIPDSVFQGFDKLTEITIPEGVTKIGQSAFFKCTSLQKVILPESLTVIDDSAFASTGLTKITLPSTLQKIGVSAFAGCPLTEIFVPESVTVIEGGAFANTEIKSFHIHQNIEQFGGILSNGAINQTQPFHSSALESITVDPENAVYEGDGKAVWTKDTNILVIAIGELLDRSFDGHLVNALILPQDREVLCIPGFKEYANLTALHQLPSLKGVILSEGTVCLAEESLKGSFEWIVFPKSLKSFYSNTLLASNSEFSKLKTLYYAGTKEGWNAVEILENKNTQTIADDTEYHGLKHATICFYSENEPTEEGNYWRYVDGLPVKW